MGYSITLKVLAHVVLLVAASGCEKSNTNPTDSESASSSAHQHAEFETTSPSMPPREPLSLLHTAALEGDIKSVRKLVKEVDDVDNLQGCAMPPLCMAVIWGHTDVVRILIEHGANPQLLCVGLTPLHHAARKGHAEVGRLLIDSGVDINAVAEDGTTPLTTSAYWGHTAVAILLVKQGADLSIKDPYGRTAVEVAKDRGFTELADTIRRFAESPG